MTERFQPTALRGPTSAPADQPNATGRDPRAVAEIALPIAGMTCASCVNRIERFLRKTDGVADAQVNLATEIATVRYEPGVTGRAELEQAVEAAGYELKPLPTAQETEARRTLRGAAAADDAERARAARAILVEAAASIAVAIGLMTVMFWPQTSVPMETINWLALGPATFIQAWAGRRFYRAAWRAGGTAARPWTR